MALDILAEALARIEHKLDQLLNHLQPVVKPMHFAGLPCPICKNTIDYIIDISKNVVVRRCGCSTGKLPMSIPLTPVIPNGVNNGNANGSGGRSLESSIDPEASHGFGRKNR